MPTENAPILIAYDGSDHAKRAIELCGRELRTDRRAVVLTVWQPLESVPFFGAAVTPVATEFFESVSSHAQKVAEEGAGLAREAGFEAEAVVVEGAPVWECIIASADAHDAGMIVLGSHGRTGIDYLMMGSVATAVAHRAKRPVLVSRG
jgi:nucleotide-binding universal stress UspA family protein